MKKTYVSPPTSIFDLFQLKSLDFLLLRGSIRAPRGPLRRGPKAVAFLAFRGIRHCLYLFPRLSPKEGVLIKKTMCTRSISCVRVGRGSDAV